VSELSGAGTADTHPLIFLLQELFPFMATPAQIAANRRNALKSTGPKSPETKAIVSQNRRTHGLCGDFVVLETESQEQFELALQKLTTSLNPANDLERELVRDMAESMWQRKRAARLQNACFEIDRDADDVGPNQAAIEVNEGLEKFLRYEAHHNRVFHHALTALQKLQKERYLQQIGFERQQRAAAEEKRRETPPRNTRKLPTSALLLDPTFWDLRYAISPSILLSRVVLHDMLRHDLHHLVL
jgi:hypothetical protein